MDDNHGFICAAVSENDLRERLLKHGWPRWDNVVHRLNRVIADITFTVTLAAHLVPYLANQLSSMMQRTIEVLIIRFLQYNRKIEHENLLVIIDWTVTETEENCLARPSVLASVTRTFTNHA